jgi:hypothetical protein
MLRAEESLFLCAFTPREIPHFVRNDNKKTMSTIRDKDRPAVAAFFALL